MISSPFFWTDQLKAFPVVSFKFLKVKLEESILTLTLARSEKRNAFNQTMAEEIAFALGYANLSDAVRCIVIKAEGPVFCAGADLNSFLASVEATDRQIPEPISEVNLGDAFAHLYKPSIAQVEGPVYAGGFLILTGTTLAYCVPTASFSLPEVKRGIWPMQVMASLLPVVPRRKVLEMCITGQPYGAEAALEMGLVSGVFPPGEIDEKVNKIAALITKNAPLAISRGMKTLQTLEHYSGRSPYRFLQEELHLLLRSEDAREGIISFQEKREPVWKNR